MTPVKYKFFSIQQNGEEQFEGHPVYRIHDKANAQIGIISWYKPWKRYVFSSMTGCVFDASCLRDVLDFMEDKINK